jgi:hypothetical protein
MMSLRATIGSEAIPIVNQDSFDLRSHNDMLVRFGHFCDRARLFGIETFDSCQVAGK